MDRRTAAVLLGLGVAAGFAAAAIIVAPRGWDPGPGVRPVSVPDVDGPLADRVAALESALAMERDARQLLEDELFALHAELEVLQGEQALPAHAAADRARITEANEAPQVGEGPVFQSRDEARTAALLDAGFSMERAAYVMRREDELEVAAMQARFEAQRTGNRQGMLDAIADSAATLRQELGDAEYERYLDAMNRPTSVRIGNVLASSPGERAGLERGDEIIRYDGVRVFDYTDLNRRQLEGAAGEDVVVEIVRDGISMQIVMPRGPIGIEATRRWRR
jgi:membrane-associated protease RseP (regulator of RpoE activity)